MSGLEVAERVGLRFVKKLPEVLLGFGYGSGVFLQKGLYPSDGDQRPQLDFMFGVDDPIAWHAEVRFLETL